MHCREFRTTLSAYCVLEVFRACGVAQLLSGDGFHPDDGFHPEGGVRPEARSTLDPGKCGSKAMELMAIFGTHPDEVDKELIALKPFNIDEGFMKTFRQAVMSWTLTCAEALQAFFNDNAAWKLGGPRSDSLHRLWSERRVAGQAFRTPNLLEGDTGEFYPFLWRVMKLEGHQRFLKKQMFDFEDMGVY